MSFILDNHLNIANMTLTQKAYSHLKQQILACDYMPGQDIFEKQLYEEMDYGRTPIREALLALKNEKLIEIFPRKGMRVKPFSEEYINEIYQIRKLMEPSIAMQYKEMYSKRVLLDFAKKFKNTCDDITFYALDIDFHLYFIAITQNQTLIHFYKQLLIEQYRLAMYASKLKISVRISNDPQHEAIINAMLTEDEKSIRESFLFHLNHSLVTSLKTLNS
ncbi:MAG: GntR family transcriptional regulator [Lachnospiraceae bacterium]